MFPAQFEYHRAESLDEALSLLGQHGGAKVLAGGHSLLPMMKLRLAQPPALVDIGRVGELRGIRRSGDSLRIGSLTTHAEVAASKEIRSGCAILAEAAGKIGDPHVRNLGTVGGNIAHADPASDLPAVLVALAATIHLKSAGGSRQVAAGDFFLDLLTTDMKPGEILTAVEVPVLQGAGSVYLKVEHPASGYAICGAAAVWLVVTSNVISPQIRMSSPPEGLSVNGLIVAGVVGACGTSCRSSSHGGKKKGGG